jgi:hypothetical protein
LSENTASVHNVDDAKTQEYVAIVEELIRDFDATAEIEMRRKDVNVGLLMFGLAKAAVRTSAAALALWRQGFELEAAPQVRLVFELGVKAQWVYHHRNEGFDAMVSVGARGTKRLAKQALDAGFSVPEDVLADLASDVRPRTAASNKLESFEKVCGDVRASDNLYLIYRTLSSYSHAGSQLAQRFLDLDEEGKLKPASPPSLGFTGEAWTLGVGLVYASRAFDEWCMTKPRKRALRAAAQRLGVPPLLLPK